MRQVSIRFALTAVLAMTACLPFSEDGARQPLSLDAPTVNHMANERIAEHTEGVIEAATVFSRSSRLEEAIGDDENCRSTSEEAPDCESESDGSTFDFSEAGEGLREWFRDHVFNDDAVESSTETSVTYRLLPEKMCPLETDENGIDIRDAKCVRFFTEQPVRLHVTSLSEGNLDVALTVGEFAAATIELYVDHVSVQTDLNVIKAIIDEVARMLDENTDILTGLSGVVKLTLTRHAPADYSAALSILESLHGSLYEPTHEEHLELKLGAASDAVSIRLSADTGLVQAHLGLANIDLAAALDLIAGQSECELDGEEEECPAREPKQGVVTLALAGLTGNAQFNVDEDALTFDGLGIGNEKGTVKLDGAQLLSLEINPDEGGLFGGLVASQDNSTQTRFEVSPSLFVALEHDLTAYVNALGNDAPEVPAWLMTGTASLNATGDSRVVAVYTQAPPEPLCESEDESTCPPAEEDQLQLVEGTVTLSASDVDDVVISAPECLVIDGGDEDEDNDRHLFTFVSGGQCR